MTVRANNAMKLLQRLQKLVEDARRAGYDDTIAFDLDQVLEHYERFWNIKL